MDEKKKPCCVRNCNRYAVTTIDGNHYCRLHITSSSLPWLERKDDPEIDPDYTGRCRHCGRGIGVYRHTVSNGNCSTCDRGGAR